MMKKYWKGIVLGVLVLIAGGFFFVFPAYLERSSNRVLERPAYTPSPEAQALHRTLTIVDLHCDALLWNRNLLKRHNYGHVDIPRLIEGNVALEAFTIVSKVPPGLNIERNEGKRDVITLLAVAQRWPVRTWTSLKERAVYQAEKLQRFAQESNGRFVLIRSQNDLKKYLERRRNNPELTAGFIGVEGAHVLEGKLENVEVLFDAGIRMMAPTHFFDNEVAGSAHGVKKGGLTDFGRQVIREMERRSMIIDLAHASEATIQEVTSMIQRPVVVSHTGVRATCNNQRNLSDDLIRAIAATGGIIGVGFWETATCGRDARAIARAMRHIADLVGVQHIGLGSDFDGAVPEPFDVTGLVEITDALLQEGFSHEEIRLIMGRKVINLLLQALPE